MTDLPVFTAAALEAVPPFDVASFSKEDAFELGVIAALLVRERDLNLAIDVVLAGDLVFRAKFKDTDAGNDPWLAGKAAVAERYGVPSLLVRRRYEEAGTPFAELTDPSIDHDTMKAHGGSIPIFVQGRFAGTITASGEPDVIDHQTAADAVAAFRERHAR
ncbi:heme-binding protein [Herbiconiux daphne]|uniref:Heme-binding protein n=1 Tax=Herbiconiux daphne TaxID=2970914 RepID=A0ABT2H7F3_9MICO|nr:heme-binding protein [Herbiconiux daphne]MCS5735851.1 heme-binding protein [Herbiconiux daphne]